MATILPFRTSTYARNVYLYGNQTLTSLPAEYVEPVKEYAANNFTQAQLDEALAKGFISQTEYDNTMAYKA